MKRYILSETQTRQEYKRRHKALQRAARHELDIALLDEVYGAIIRHGHTTETARDVLALLAEAGAFGICKGKE